MERSDSTMKAVLRIAIAAVSAAIAFSSCENLNDEYISVSDEIVINASVAEQSVETRSAIDVFGSEKVTYTWLAGDAISVFFGDSEGSIFVTDVTASKAQFKGTIGAVTGGGDDLTDETSLWGVYPYGRNTTCDGSSVTLTLPYEQGAAPDTFADDLFPSIARSTNFTMAFYPVCGSIRFKVSNPDIVKVTLSGNNNEDLAGKATVSMPLGGVPAMSSISEGQKELVMTAPGGGCFETDRYYYFVLYPQTLTKGLTLTYYKEDEKASYVLNSSVKVGRNRFLSATNKDSGLTFTGIQGGEIGGEDKVQVTKIYMITSSVTMAPGTSYVLETDYEPYNASNTEWQWSSSDVSVAYVDGSGKVTAIGDGTATITATATDGGGVSASCTVIVKAATAVADVEYKDEYGVDHGYGIAIGDVVWAPVNCGYKAPTVDEQGNVTDKGYPYGKLYQWGRKYGQGYTLEYDSTVPEAVEGPVMISVGSNPSNANLFYCTSNNWALSRNDELWNIGTENVPKRNDDYDPCPNGWRVPTQEEIGKLSENHSRLTTNSINQKGYYFTGEYTYMDNAMKLFFPAGGSNDRRLNSLSVFSKGRDEEGYYWSSMAAGASNAYCLFFSSNVSVPNTNRARGFSVRCVQE